MKYIPNIGMPTIKVSGYLPADVDKFSRDEEAKEQRQEVLARQKKNTFFATIRETLKSIGAPLTGAGLGLFIAGTLDAPEDTADIIKDTLKSATENADVAEEALKDATDAYTAVDVDSTAVANAEYNVAKNNLESAQDVLSKVSDKAAKLESSGKKQMAGIGMIAGAAAANAGALMANSIGAKYAHAASFDQSELNAQHNAKYIRQEFEEMRAEQMNAQPVVVFNNPEAERSDGKSWAEHVDEQRAAVATQEQQV